jgi:hypothetical protein
LSNSSSICGVRSPILIRRRRARLDRLGTSTTEPFSGPALEDVEVAEGVAALIASLDDSTGRVAGFAVRHQPTAKHAARTAPHGTSEREWAWRLGARGIDVTISGTSQHPKER